MEFDPRNARRADEAGVAAKGSELDRRPLGRYRERVFADDAPNVLEKAPTRRIVGAADRSAAGL